MAVTILKSKLFQGGSKLARATVLKRRLDLAWGQWNRVVTSEDDPADIFMKRVANPQLMHLTYKMPKLADRLRALGEFYPSVPGEYGYGKELRSGAYCNCGHCGFEGYCYGAPHSGGRGHDAGVSAPWCKQCGINNQLRVVQS